VTKIFLGEFFSLGVELGGFFGAEFFRPGCGGMRFFWLNYFFVRNRNGAVFLMNYFSLDRMLAYILVLRTNQL
jgi:hypothetical protein